MIVHCCDIGNPAKPLAYCLQWTERIMAEMFAQVGPPTYMDYLSERSIAVCEVHGVGHTRRCHTRKVSCLQLRQ